MSPDCLCGHGGDLHNDERPFPCERCACSGFQARVDQPKATSATGGADVEALPVSTARQVDLPDIRRRWNRLRQLPFNHDPSKSSEDAERRNIEFVLVQDDVPWLVNQVAALRAERDSQREDLGRSVETIDKLVAQEADLRREHVAWQNRALLAEALFMAHGRHAPECPRLGERVAVCACGYARDWTRFKEGYGTATAPHQRRLRARAERAEAALREIAARGQERVWNSDVDAYGQPVLAWDIARAALAAPPEAPEP